jgi:hypothetical protein
MENALQYSCIFESKTSSAALFVGNVRQGSSLNPQLHIIMLKVILLFLLCTLQAVASDPALYQVIHNSADTSLQYVDVYLNGEKILGKMPFRTATPFVPVASDASFRLAITRANAMDTLLALTYRPEPGIATTFLLQGMADTARYAPNPEGKSIRLGWGILENITMKSLPKDEVAVKISDGCTDLAMTDLIARDVAPLLPSMGYGGATPTTITMPPQQYEFLLLEPMTRVLVRSLQANLSSMGGRPVVVFFSGFANPLANAGGAPLGLYAAMLDGTVVNIGIPSTVEEMAEEVGIRVYARHGEWIVECNDGEYDVRVYSLLGEEVTSVTATAGGLYVLGTIGSAGILIAKHRSGHMVTKLLLR